MRKEKIVKIALIEMLSGGVEQVNIKNIVKRTRLDENKLNELFINGDKELLMDAIEYAGKSWVYEIKMKVQDKFNISEKIEILACGYTMGSKYYPQSLSTYIDLWKIVKDLKDEYVKMRLKSLYDFYISEFMSIVKDIGFVEIPENDLNSFAVLMTILSDVLHIQSIVLEKKINFDNLSNVITKISKQFFIGDET